MLSFKVKCAILIFGELEAVKHERLGLRASELKVRLGFPRGIQQLLTSMKAKGLLDHDAYRGWYSISADPRNLTLWELINIVDKDDEQCSDWPPLGSEYPLATSFGSALLDDFIRKASGMTVADLIARGKD